MDLAGLHSAYLRRRYEVLFYSLVFTLVATPVCAALHIPHTVVEIFLAANLLAAMAPLETRITRRILLALFVAIVPIRLAVPEGWILGTAFVLGTALGVVAAGSALRYALTARIVGREHVCAGLSGYLLLGLFCGHLYWAMERYSPGSLSVATDPQARFTVAKGVYFSFATLTTCGYGDIVPRTELARGFATLEAVAGQLYLAVLVARLIGLYVSRKSAGPS